MKILWIEDNPNISQLEKDLFLSSGLFDNGMHKILKPRNFDDLYRTVSYSINCFDFVVIDIDLRNFEMGKEGQRLCDSFEDLQNPNDFLSEAGFHLYLKLMVKGFDNNRIVFLTGNTDIRRISSLLNQFISAYENKDEERIEKIIAELRQNIKDDEYDELTKKINESNLNNIKEFWKNLANEYEKTNEPVNTYPKFYERFQKARLELPKDIHKDNVNEFHDWLRIRLINNYSDNSSMDFEYITLRRGIIEACIELKNKLETVAKLKIKKAKDLKDLNKITNPVDNFILFNKTCYESSENLSKDYIIDYLTKLETFFPLNSPDNKEQLFYLFLKELSAEWEMSKGHFSKNNPVSFDFDSIEFKFKESCQRQMKLLRNWTSHNQLTKDLNEKEVAFFFMLTMRALFNLGTNKIYNYEKILAGIFDKTIEVGKEKIEQLLVRSYSKIRYEMKKEHLFANGVKFHDMIQYIGKSLDDKKNFRDKVRDRLSKKLFYQNFWHGLFPARLFIENPEKDQKDVKISIEFIQDILLDNSFPDFLGKLIYDESF